MGLPTTRLGRKWVLVGLAKTELILPGPPSSAFAKFLQTTHARSCSLGMIARSRKYPTIRPTAPPAATAVLPNAGRCPTFIVCFGGAHFLLPASDGDARGR